MLKLTTDSVDGRLFHKMDNKEAFYDILLYSISGNSSNFYIGISYISLVKGTLFIPMHIEMTICFI